MKKNQKNQQTTKEQHAKLPNMQRVETYLSNEMMQSNKTDGLPKYGNYLLNNNGNNYSDIENLNFLNANFWLQMQIEILQYATLSSTNYGN